MMRLLPSIELVVLRVLVIVMLALLDGGALGPPASAAGEDPNAHKAKSMLDGIERKIIKEPKYVSSPRYALLVLGTKAESKVWLVEDGKTLYVDGNANGDLTDDGPPIAPSKL